MNSKNALKLILEDYASLPEYSEMCVPTINTKSLFNDYPINIAATRGILSEVKTLFENGADVNSKGEHGYTPLHNAIEQGHMEIVEFLLNSGADGNIKNKDGITPLELAKLIDEKKIYDYVDQWGRRSKGSE